MLDVVPSWTDGRPRCGRRRALPRSLAKPTGTGARIEPYDSLHARTPRPRAPGRAVGEREVAAGAGQRVRERAARRLLSRCRRRGHAALGRNHRLGRPAQLERSRGSRGHHHAHRRGHRHRSCVRHQPQPPDRLPPARTARSWSWAAAVHRRRGHLRAGARPALSRPRPRHHGDLARPPEVGRVLAAPGPRPARASQAAAHPAAPRLGVGAQGARATARRHGKGVRDAVDAAGLGQDRATPHYVELMIRRLAAVAMCLALAGCSATTTATDMESTTPASTRTGSPVATSTTTTLADGKIPTDCSYVTDAEHLAGLGVASQATSVYTDPASTAMPKTEEQAQQEDRNWPGLGCLYASADAEQEATLLVLSLIHISEPTRRTPISYAVF